MKVRFWFCCKRIPAFVRSEQRQGITSMVVKEQRKVLACVYSTRIFCEGLFFPAPRRLIDRTLLE